jgi:subtilisin family serine protease
MTFDIASPIPSDARFAPCVSHGIVGVLRLSATFSGELWNAQSDAATSDAVTQPGRSRPSRRTNTAPAVAGVVALCLAEAAARGLSLDAASVRDIVTSTARHDPPAAEGWDDRYGHGRVDAAAALRAVEVLATPTEDVPVRG